MDLDTYQVRAATTAVYKRELRVLYPALGLANEAGEVAGKVKKVLRDNDGIYDPERVAGIAAELGDTLWYLAVTARDLGISLSDIAQGNLDKLASRQERGTLQGSGDNR